MARQAESPSRVDNSSSWQQSLANIVRSPVELLQLLQLDSRQAPEALDISSDFPLRVPREFVQRMRTGDWQDPLLLQVLPLGKELDYQPGFCSDPLQEEQSNPIPGLIHKYRGRVLLVVSGGCAIHCRYCFRRHFPYTENNPGRSHWQPILDYIRSDPSIHEVILSGGDPLVASDRHLAELVEALADIPQLSTLRVHSRLPVVIPARISADCLQWLTATRLQTVMVIHCNHANELDNAVLAALQRLKSAGITTLNQTVLLRGINDSIDSLCHVSERLFTAGCLPYYLHQLDKVQGAAHFEVSDDRALALHRQLIGRLPGYLVPRLVREVAGADAKLPVAST